jgi:para-nitrobenzyl esterase
MRNYIKTTTFLTILFLAINLHAFSQTTASSTTVKVEGGLVDGTIENGITIYRGIPFAAPPVGDLRWCAPQPVKSWEDVLKADKFGPACPQQLNIVTAYYTKYGMSEDCLYLNIWKPNSSLDKKLPVMVWIYGGGFNMGSTSQDMTTGEQLAKKGVIVVGIGYRIGALGFLAHPELSSESENHVSGNYGLLDQIAALKWIQHNIIAFGGDPDCVTIFGLSAGGQSVSILAASPLAKGLFQRAICMSGGSFRPASIKKDVDCLQILKGAEADGLELAKNMGVNSIAELRKIDPQKFVSNPSTSTGYWPVMDGYVIADDLYKLYETGNYNDVPLLIGNTSAEGTIFILASKPGEYVETTRQKFGPVTDKILSLYPEGTEDITRRSMGDLFRDTYFGWHTYTWASLQTKTGKSPVFVYYFDQSQPASPVTLLQKSDRAYHGSDCSYVFGHLDQEPTMKYTDEDRQLSELMVNYWINFAKYGNPNKKGMPEWPVYNVENPTVMYLKGNPKAEPLPNLDKLKVIDEYYTWKRALGEGSK